MRNLTPVQNTILHPFALFGYSDGVVAKSTTERGNSSLLSANNRTPIRAFFIRSTSTPKENALSILLSMIACNGQRLIVGCLPIVTVFHPVTSYRPITVESEAIAPIKQLSELLAMTTYLFAGIVRTDLSNKIHTLRIDANSLLEARAKLAKTYVLVCIGKLPHTSHNQFSEVANA